MSRARKYKKNRRASGTPRPNPGFMAGLAGELLPTLAGFVGSRLATRMLTIMIGKRWPKFAKHAGALSGVGVFAATYWGADRVKALSKYQDGLVVGTGLGAIATIVQTYIPVLGWMFAEVKPAELAPPAGANDQLPTGDYGNEWDGTYSDAFDAGRYTPAPSSVPKAVNVPAAAMPEVQQADAALDDLMAELQTDEGGGIFGGPN